MHVIVWKLDGSHYATPTENIVEVIPVVETATWPNACSWFLGLANYRGTLITVLDMAVLLGHRPQPQQMANRIIVVRSQRSAGATDSLVGLLVHEVLGSDTLEFQIPDAASHSSHPASEVLGHVALTSAGVVRLVDHLRIPSAQPAMHAQSADGTCRS